MIHWLTKRNSRRSIALAMLFALLLTLAPAKVQAASDQNPDVIVAQATNADKNEDGQLYRYYFGSVAKDNSDGSLTAAFYRNWNHAPDCLSEDMGVIMKVTGSADARNWSTPEVWIDQAFMESYGWGMRRDRKGTELDGSDDTLYYGYKYDEYYYNNPDEAPTDGKLYYYYDSENQKVWVTKESIEGATGYDIEIRDPNLQTLNDGTIIFTFFSRIYRDAIVNGKQLSGYDANDIYTNCRTFIMYSRDGGTTWSDPTMIPTTYLDEACSKRGTIAEFSDGELLICMKGRSSQLANHGYYVTTTSTIRANLDRTTGVWSFHDEVCNYNGATTNLGAFGSDSNEVAFGVTTVNGVETTYALLRPDGRLLKSTDNGLTWTQIDVVDGNLHQPGFAKISGTNDLFVTWTVPQNDPNFSRNVYGRVFDPDLGWDATKTQLLYENTEIDWATSGKYQTGWRWDMGDPCTVQLNDGTLFTMFYDTGLRIVGGALNSVEAMYQLTPTFDSSYENDRIVVLNEDFEDNSVGLYPAGDVLTNVDVPSVQVVQQDSSNVLQYQKGSGSQYFYFSATEGDCITLDFRMPESGGTNQTFSIYMKDKNSALIQLRQAASGAGFIRFVDGGGNHLGIKSGEENIYANIENAFQVGADAPWYSVKLYLFENSVYMKLWERGTSEPAAFQYVMSSDSCFVDETGVCLRFMANDFTPNIELDNLQVTRKGSLTLDKTSHEAQLGDESIQLNATVSPAVETAKVTWTSNNASAATVDQNGNVTFVGAGEAVITASSGTCKATCTVTVIDDSTEKYVASLNCSDTDLDVGEQLTVNVVVNSTDYENFASGEVILTYDNTKLSFNKTASSLGSATIPEQVNGTIKLEDYGETKSFGNAYTLVFDAIAEGAANVTMTSAKFSTYAHAAGNDLVTAALSNATVEATFTQVYSVSLPSGFSGNSTVKKGDSYTFTANDTSNYTYVVTATMGEQNVAVTDNQNGSYTIANVSGALVITATKTAKSYTVTFAGTGADDVADKVTTATYGTPYTFTMPSATGYAYSAAITYTGTENAVEYSTDDAGVVTIAGDKITGAITITVTKTQTDANMSVVGTGASDVTLPDRATPGTDLIFTVTMDDRYDYVVTATVNDVEVTLTPGENGQYTLAGSAFKQGDTIKISVTKAAKTSNVDVKQYITVDKSQMWLITINTTKMDGAVYTYGGNQMFWSDKYNNNSGAYCYLVVSTEQPTITASDLAIVTGAATEVSYEMDVNMTGKVDANDAQLAYNMYKPYYANFTDDVTMEEFLRADVNFDGIVSINDAQAIINSLLS